MNFGQNVAQLQVKAEAEAARPRPQPKQEQAPTVTLNQREIQKLLADTEGAEAVLDLRPGDIHAITAPDGLVMPRELDRLVDKYLQLIGRLLHEVLPNPPGEVSLGRWHALDVGHALRGGFDGNVCNLRMKLAPATREEVKTLDTASSSSVPFESVRRVVFDAELMPTRRTPRPVQASLLMYVRIFKHRAQIVKALSGFQTTGPAVAKALREEASARAATGSAVDDLVAERQQDKWYNQHYL